MSILCWNAGQYFIFGYSFKGYFKNLGYIILTISRVASKALASATPTLANP
jgi:hypothetical protein